MSWCRRRHLCAKRSILQSPGHCDHPRRQRETVVTGLLPFFLHSRLRQVRAMAVLIRHLSYKIPYITCTTALLSICSNLQRLSSIWLTVQRSLPVWNTWKRYPLPLLQREIITASQRIWTLLLFSAFCISFGLIFSIKKLRGFSPPANYTDRVTADCRRT
jgi:hypothetical protein